MLTMTTFDDSDTFASVIMGNEFNELHGPIVFVFVSFHLILIKMHRADTNQFADQFCADSASFEVSRSRYLRFAKTGYDHG